MTKAEARLSAMNALEVDGKFPVEGRDFEIVESTTGYYWIDNRPASLKKAAMENDSHKPTPEGCQPRWLSH